MGCHASMWETGQADHQVWFSDACRQRPEIVKRFESLTGAWKPGNIGRRRRGHPDLPVVRRRARTRSPTRRG